MKPLHPLERLPEEWGELLEARGVRRFRGQQVFQWLHRRGVSDAAKMTNLSRELRTKLAEESLELPLTIADVRRSASGTRKLLLELAGGGRIECVMIPMTKSASWKDADAGALDDDPDDELPPQKRVTLCISTQYGCAMGCVFCASGQAGLQRGLSAAEVIAQVMLARQQLEPGEVLRNLVFMGMGEPLHHYEQTARAIRVLTHADGLDLSPRRITVSTVGLVPGIERLGADFDGKVGLAVSVHAPDDATRSSIMPMNQRYPLADLMRALRDYPLPKRRRITIEYTLIRGVNDAPAQAEQLAERLAGLRIKVNLIPMNPIGASDMRAPDDGVVKRFADILDRHRVSCFVRTRRGSDVDAACGQLALAGDLVKKRRGASTV